MIRIPLFPLGLVLLPGMSLPLHIFEERYKQMIAECLADDRPFGIVLFDGQSVRSVGCTARIFEVLKRYDDGRLDILTRGEQRFVVHELFEEKPYMEARVTFFEDDSEARPAGRDPELLSAARRLLSDLRKEGFLSPDPAPPLLSDPGSLSFFIASLEGFSHSERQQILEMTSSTQRLQKCVEALSKIRQRFLLTQTIEKIIGGNGRPPESVLRKLSDKPDN
jgi:Lon protease-like protein